MKSEAAVKIIQMIESLPKKTQNRAVAHLEEYLESLKDEILWDDLFSKTQEKLAKSGQKAHEDIKDGKSFALRTVLDT